MLYQPQPKTRSVTRFLRLVAAIAAGALASMFARRADQAYLEGMRPEELTDIGLRRTDDGQYRPFGD